MFETIFVTAVYLVLFAISMWLTALMTNGVVLGLAYLCSRPWMIVRSLGFVMGAGIVVSLGYMTYMSATDGESRWFERAFATVVWGYACYTVGVAWLIFATAGGESATA